MLFLVSCVGSLLGSDAELRKTASWQWPPISKIEGDVKAYLESHERTAEPRQDIESRLASLADFANGPQRFDYVLTILSMLDERFQRVVAGESQAGAATDIGWLDESIAPWIRNNLQLAIGRGLAHRLLYDEASQILKGIDSAQVVDPSTLFFYRAVCHHHLLQKEECLAVVGQLLERESELASRYAVTGRLMQSDIAPLKEDSLDEISRLMNDVHRRLDLGRSGKIVRDQEKQIVDKLDKMIDQIEQQLQEQQKQQQQEQQESQGDKSRGQGKPMDDSRPAGTYGPGDVDPKSIGSKGGWGNLPPAQRQESLQNITKDLPSHYREVIEAYFKALATENR
jgi:hypothetical protein